MNGNGRPDLPEPDRNLLERLRSTDGISRAKLYEWALDEGVHDLSGFLKRGERLGLVRIDQASGGHQELIKPGSKAW